MIRLLAFFSSRKAGCGCRGADGRLFRAARFGVAWGCCVAAISVASVQAEEATEAATTVAAATNAADVSGTKVPRDESRFIRANFSDGTILIGELLLDELEVETEFGTLIVPRKQLLGLSPGLDSRSGFDERVDELVAALASSDRTVAAAAERELTRLGPSLSSELARRADELEGDHAKRLRSLIDRIEEAESDLDAFDEQETRQLIRKDRVRTTRFTIVGRILPRELRFKSRYGEIEADLADVVVVERQTMDEREDVARSFSVTGQNLVQTQMKKTGVSVRKGDRIVVRASGMIRRSAGTSTYVSSPDGSTRFGNHSTNPQILGGTLVAKIGTRGKEIKVGSNASFIAKEDGVLTFGVGMRPDYVGRYSFPGEYKVKLRVVRGD
ncbi:MAG: hypothetical protein WD875_15735 [Pirellulales bacterium]